MDQRIRNGFTAPGGLVTGEQDLERVGQKDPFALGAGSLGDAQRFQMKSGSLGRYPAVADKVIDGRCNVHQCLA